MIRVGGTVAKLYAIFAFTCPLPNSQGILTWRGLHEARFNDDKRVALWNPEPDKLSCNSSKSRENFAQALVAAPG